MIRYEVIVKPVQLQTRRLVVDTVNAVGIYLAGDILPTHLAYVERELKAGNGVDILSFDVVVHVRILRCESGAGLPLPRRDYGTSGRAICPLILPVAA
jgi:hypothetical protein